MIPRSYTAEGIVLSSIKYSEGDRIIKVYTKNFGKVSLIAKGVRKLKSKKRGSLEVFSQIKLHATNSKSLGVLTEVESLNSFKGIRSDLKKMSLAYFYCEIVDKLTREEGSNYKLYEVLLAALGKLEAKRNYLAQKEAFSNASLVALGFWPEGKEVSNPDGLLESVMERKLNSSRVGKRVLS